MESLGHDPVRATGALLLDLSAVVKLIAKSRRALIFRIARSNPVPKRTNDILIGIANKHGISIRDLMMRHKLTREEYQDPLGKI